MVYLLYISRNLHFDTPSKKPEPLKRLITPHRTEVVAKFVNRLYSANFVNSISKRITEIE